MHQPILNFLKLQLLLKPSFLNNSNKQNKKKKKKKKKREKNSANISYTIKTYREKLLSHVIIGKNLLSCFLKRKKKYKNKHMIKLTKMALIRTLLVVIYIGGKIFL